MRSSGWQMREGMAVHVCTECAFDFGCVVLACREHVLR